MLGGPLVHLFGEGVVFAALTLLLQTLAAYGVTTDSLKPRHLLAAWSFVSVREKVSSCYMHMHNMYKHM